MPTSHYVIAENFFDGAEEMRQSFEAHFANPHRHTPNHQVWNYWYVPGAYTYLRTNPTKVMPQPLVERFMQRLNGWAMAALGLTTNLVPWMSLYVDGCGQTLHNDAAAGQMGFVYSITRWDTRPFLGGETVLFHPTNYWQTDRVKASGAGTNFYDLVPSKFNQLVLFDDRVIHGVQTVQGTMDPLNGRVVLHGHLRAEAVALGGALPADAAIPAVRPVIEQIQALTRESVGHVNGFMTVRLAIAGDGRVTGVQPLCDRLLALTPDAGRVDAYRQAVVNLLAETKFPPADGETQLTLPIVAVG